MCLRRVCVFASEKRQRDTEGDRETKGDRKRETEREREPRVPFLSEGYVCMWGGARGCADHQKYGRKDHGRVDGCKLVDGLLHSGGCVLKHLHTCTPSLNHTWHVHP